MPLSAAPGLSHEAFAAATRAALRDFVRTPRLATNPLVDAQIVKRAAEPEPVGPHHVRRVIEAAAHALDAHPRDRKLLRALHATYLKPAPTQEKAAERLGLPYGTYRRHLARGTERLISILWECEQLGDATSLLAELDDD